MELFIRNYGTCQYCKGTGDVDDIERGPEDCVNCTNGIAETLIKISRKVTEWYMDKQTSEFIDYLKRIHPGSDIIK